MPIIFRFLKLYNEKCHAESLMRGKLFANRLSHFRGIEEEGRGDGYEGVIIRQLPELIKDFRLWTTDPTNGVVTSEIEIKPSDMAAPLFVGSDWVDNLNIFCVRAIHGGDLVTPAIRDRIASTGLKSLDPSFISELDSQLDVPEQFLRLGRYAVVIEPQPFIERVAKAIRSRVRSGIQPRYRRGIYGFVEYYPVDFHGTFHPKIAALRKSEEFRYQSEFRFVMDTGTKGCNPIILDIGDISDISELRDMENM